MQTKNDHTCSQRKEVGIGLELKCSLGRHKQCSPSQYALLYSYMFSSYAMLYYFYYYHKNLRLLD